MSKHQPVEVVRAYADNVDGLDIKRFYVPGCTITSKCPKCGETDEMDLEQDYLSYPSLDKPTEVLFRCASANGCETEWTGLVQVSVEIKVVAHAHMAPEQTGGVK